MWFRPADRGACLLGLKLYEDQRATMMHVLSEKRKEKKRKEKTKLNSKALKAREKEICAWRVILHKYNS
jgi:hypothetical protein